MELQGPSLRLGMQGDVVALLQKELQQLDLIDPSVTIPAAEIERRIFGEGTRATVKAFQREFSLDATGVVDPATARRINEEVAAQASRPFTVTGRVRYADGRPFVDGIVRVFDKDLRSDELLGDVRPSADGSYLIEYSPERFARAEKRSADLRVCACNADGREIKCSPIHFNARRVETIDLVVDGDVYRGPSEYERLVVELTPLTQGLRFGELTEGDQHQDVTFLSGETERDPRHIAFLIAAHRHAARADLAPEIFYAMFRHGLPASLPALMVQEPAVLRRALKQAASDNLVPARYGEDEEIDRVLARFKELVVREAVRPPAGRESRSQLLALLRTVLPDLDRQEAFVRRYVAHRGPITAFWDELRASPDLGNDVDGLQFALQTGALSGNHLPLVQELQRMRRDQEVTSARDLVRFDEAGWREVLVRPNGGGIIGAPSHIPGEGEERLANYARHLTRLVERSFPTAFVTERLKTDDLAERQNLLKFFQRNQQTFDITGARLETYLAYHPQALDDIAVDRRTAVKQQLRAMQRVYRVAPKYSAMSRLLKDGIDSAFAISRMGPTLFRLKYAELGDAAVRVYNRAESVHYMSMAISSNYGMHGSKVSTAAAPDEVPEQIEGIPDWDTLFGSLELCACQHCRSVYSPAAYLADILHFLRDRRLIDSEAVQHDDLGRIIPPVPFIFHTNEPSKHVSAKDVLFRRRPDLGEIELTCENTHTPLPYVDLVNEVLEDYVAPPPAFTPFTLDPALVSDLDTRTISPQLSASFTAPALSEHATIQLEKAGERWRLHDLAFTYAIRVNGNGTVQVTTRSRQTSASPQELAANPQYINRGAYDTLRQRVFPLTLPFDLWSAEARAYLHHLGVRRHELMETFLPGDMLTRLQNPVIAREYVGLTSADANLITGVTTGQSDSPSPGVWNVWGFPKATLDPSGSIPDPADSTAWIESGNWLEVLTGRVDIFLQQSGLKYKEMLALLGAYFVNPATGLNSRLITVQAQEDQPQDTCETRYLRIAGMDEAAALRALRFIRLWRTLGWTMRDLDRAMTALNIGSTVPLDDAVLTQLSHLQRLYERLSLPIDRMLAFWASLDTARYTDHDAGDQPHFQTTYERLFRNKNVINPPQFSDDPSALSGTLTGHAAAIAASLRINAADLSLLLADPGVIPHVGSPPAPDDALSLANLSRLYRHATLASALSLPVRDYVTALKLTGDPFTSTTTTVLFVEWINAVRAGGMTLTELDYLSRHVIVERERLAPTDQEIAAVLADLRTGLQRIAAENTFVEEDEAPGGPTLDLEGELTRQKLALLGWPDDLVDQVVATLKDAVAYRTSLAALPSGVSLPPDASLEFDATNGQLRFRGAMTLAQRDALLALSSEPDFQAAVTALFDAPRRFVRRNMRCYAIEHLSTPLATSSAVTIPPAFRARMYHDPEAGRLSFIGAMRDDERDMLLALSTDAAYHTAINELYAAPDAPPASDIFLTSGPGGDVETLLDDPTLLDPAIVPAGRFAHVLRKLLPHLRLVLSERAVVQALAESLGLEMQTARDLSKEWLDWPSHAGQKLFDAFVDPPFVESHANVAISRQIFAGQFDSYLLLHKSALIVQRFRCTPRQVRWLFTYAPAAGWPNLTALPVASQTAPAVQLEAWLRLMELFAVRNRLPRGEEALDELLGRAIAVDSTAPAMEKDTAKTAYLAALSHWTGWPTGDLAVLLGQPDDHTQTGLLHASFPGDYAGAVLLGRLRVCFGSLSRSGMSAAQCGELTLADVDHAAAAAVKQAVRAKYDESQWLTLAQPLRDVLREQQRAALVAYLVANPDDQHAWRKVSDVYGHFLIDVEMSPCQMTSRIKQAISSVQLFAQRCLMNLEWVDDETKLLASAEVDVRWREWEWMKSYRVWEANRKIFLYPENWLEPELRDGKSQFFLELESECQQTDLTKDSAEAAFRSYLAKLDAVARLEVVGMYHEKATDDVGNKAIDALHVFARTPGTAPVYFYRRRIDGRHWTAWESVDLDIQERDHLIPVVWRRRLMLIWPVFTEEVKEPDDSNVVPVQKRWKLQLAWSEYKERSWVPRKVSTSFREFDGNGPSIPKPEFFFKVVTERGALEVLCYRWLTENTQYYGEFVLRGCNSDFEVISADEGDAAAAPLNLYPHGMGLSESDLQQLYLPVSTGEYVEALQATPGARYQLLPAHQVAGFEGLRLLPWFFNDDVRTYFVVPRPPRSLNVLGPIAQAIDPGIIEAQALAPFQPLEPVDPGDPFRLVTGDVRGGRVINAGDPLLFEETFPVTSPLVSPIPDSAGDSGEGMGMTDMVASHGATSVLHSGTEMQRNVAQEFLVQSDVSLVYVKPYIGYRYTFHTFYHPYVCKLIEELNLHGVDGVLQRPLQLMSHGTQTFVDTYDPVPNGPVEGPKKYPAEDLDFDQRGAYSLYNWELFFHVPMLIVSGQLSNGRFSDALHAIRSVFDIFDASGLPVPQRYWRTKPFHQKTSTDYQREHIAFLMRLLAGGGDVNTLTGVSDLTKEQVQHDYDELVDAVEEWRKNPFKPHLVARMRTSAYQKAVVMKKCDILTALGESRQRLDTLESINEATQYYILAADILGKRPEEIPPRAIPEVHTYNTLDPLLDHFSNGLVQIEEFVPPSAISEAPGNGQTGPLTMPTMLYFCVPRNDRLLGYWDIVADRLFKIRHCMNIEGVGRQLPLFEPPIEPGLLVKAAAAGVDIASVLNEENASLPPYDFRSITTKATECLGVLNSLAAALLSALEKRDSEKLALLRTEQETALLKLVEDVRARQVDEAEQQIAALKASREIAVTRLRHFQNLLGTSVQIPDAPTGGDAAVAAPDEVTTSSGHPVIQSGEPGTDENGLRMISFEKTELSEMQKATDAQLAASDYDRIANVAYFVPRIAAEPWGVGVEYGGDFIGTALSAIAGLWRDSSANHSYKANRAERLASHVMRAHDWLLQARSELRSIAHIDQQIVGQYIRKDLAQKELDNHRKQIEQAQAVEEVLREKYTNPELYNWMIGQISPTHFRMYQLTYRVCKLAERAFRYKLGLHDSNFIQFGHWDSVKKGLLAGEQLLYDLKRMEVAYLEQDKREFEITKHVSLARLDPVALVQLKQTGQCLFTVPEVLFDLDYPGHYMRRIKSVGVTIPCITGPYTSVNCTLTLVRSTIRHSSSLSNGEYGRNLDNDDPRFRDSLGAVQSIVTSGGQNDSGLFEKNLRDERFLPCEGAGAISTWRIELPNEFRQFDYDTISDVVLHLQYTARPGGGLLKERALEEMREAVNAIARAEQAQGLARLFSVRHEFGSEWHRFLHPSSPAADQTLTLSLDKSRFPFLVQNMIAEINKIELFVKVDREFLTTHNQSSLRFTLEVGESAPNAATALPADILPMTSWRDLETPETERGMLHGEKMFSDEPGNWTLTAWRGDGDRLDPKALDDLVFVCHYSLASP